MDFCENDWRLFKRKIGIWQETYIEHLNREYIDILNEPICASEKFWKLEKHINSDKKKTGVIVEMKRSNMISALISLLNEKAITFEDLEEFSDETKSKIKFLMGD